VLHRQIMNSIIESLNHSGEHALHFAWLMFWQSSLLIALVYGLERGLRHRVRAGVRYALWLLVLVKLVLPPSLAFPTAPSWWLLSAAVPRPVPHPAAVVVRYGEGLSVGPAGQVTSIATEPPRARMSLAAVALAIWVASSAGLLAWLAVRWWRIAREARDAQDAPAWLTALVEETRRVAGVRGKVRLKLLEKAVSPAVCGLVRPVVLIPRALALRLPPAQVRAILCHEMVHLRRGDVWVNCFQGLAQIAYWWHPLLWLANSRIRCVREEAVDDAVMVALREEAESYAPTLLEVARLALHRPLASLGLVGILESQRSLRQRIERLLDFCPPRKAGLTFGSVVCVLAFGAFAVPMGQGPGKEKAVLVAVADEKPLLEHHSAPASHGGQVIQSVKTEPASQQPPAVPTNKSVLVSDREGALLVHAELTDLDVIEQAGQTLNMVPPQILIQTKLIALPMDFAEELWREQGVTNVSGTNLTTILAPAQTRALLKAIQSNPKANVVNEAAVTTLTGRQTQIQCVDLMTILKLNPQALEPPGVSTDGTGTNGVFLIDTVGLGPTMDVVPIVGDDGRTIQLTLLVGLNEFLGYDQPSNSVPVYVQGKKQRTLPPLPHFHLHRVSKSVAVQDGHTVILGDMVSEKIATLKDKIPVLGDIPLLGRLFRSESRSTEMKRLMVFVTPSLVDPAGNRLHKEEEDSEARVK
jgi:beta-lactamase regulating signal transducer with metallopeptidase domain